MKKALYALLIGVAAFGCKRSPDEMKAVLSEQKQNTQASVNEVVNSIIYIKDPRTSLCFAYYWGGAANGGPALTVVPSESIPTNLLWIANIPTNNLER